MDNFDFRYCLDRGKKLYRQGKFFEARSYLKRAFLIWPWDPELKKLLGEVEVKINMKEEGNYAGNKTGDGIEI